MFLAGCGSKPKIEYVTEYKTVNVVLTPPAEFYRKTPRVKPPNSTEYVNATWEQKEEMLFGHIKELNSQITSLMTDRVSIDSWITKQKSELEAKKK